MGLLPRVWKLVVGTAVLLALLSLPTPRTVRDQGSALAPSIAWAGGSPDETLTPKDGPSRSSLTGIDARANTDTTRMQAWARLTTLQRWEIIFRVIRFSATRL